jgi:hypothetical protein
LDNAGTAGYLAVSKAAIDDFTKLSGRVNLDLGSSGTAGEQPTPTRLKNFKSNAKADPQLVTLMFNYGRHLLIASSRDTGPRSLPGNLQGIWNKDYKPSWQSKYTININLQMNYWHALVTNLAETQKPIWDLLNIAIPRGEAVAKKMYGCDNGYVLHHNTDLWGDAAPVDKGVQYTVWPMGGSWLASDAMEHYRFTQNKTYLQQTAWPILQKTAQFYYCYLFKWKDYWTAGPSVSPENLFTVPSGMTRAGSREGTDISVEMDNQLLWQLFTDVKEACTVLGLTGTECEKAPDYLSKIRPPKVGSKGAILEWREEYGEVEPGHRHMSPLWGLYPGKQLTPLVSQTLAKAGKVFVDRRMSSGSGSTGWSRAWVVNLYARLLQGDTVWSNIQAFISKYPSNNLWNTDGGPGTAFQIDGNFGLAAGIAEMLLQSHEVVHLLPALPSAVPSGSAKGLVARGNFVVDMTWSKGALTEATITSRSGGPLAIRVRDGTTFSVNDTPYSGPINTSVGGVYKIASASRS